MPEMRLRLQVAPCKVSDARAAIMRWHYSRRVPVGRLVCHGVWESDRWAGAIVYGRGATPTLGDPYGLDKLEVCELVRVALAPGRTVPTSRALGVSLRMLQRSNPQLRLVVSFADAAQGHVGTLYQATNWLYFGLTSAAQQFFYKGRWCHNREISSGAFGKGGAVANMAALPKRTAPPKHRYLYPLDEQLRTLLAQRAQPYPKHSEHA